MQDETKVDTGDAPEVAWNNPPQADERGLVFALKFDRDGNARRIDWPEFDAWTPDDGVLWLHFERRKLEQKDWLTDQAGLLSADAAALLQYDTRPRMVAFDDVVMLVLRGVNLTPGVDPEDMVSLRLWVERSQLISIRRTPVYAMNAVRDLCERGKGPDSSSAILAALVAQLVENMAPCIEQIDETIDELEEKSIAKPGTEIAVDLTSVRQRIVALRRYVAPRRTVLQRLHNEVPDWFSDSDKARLREAANEAARLTEWLDADRERAVLLNDEITTRLAEQTNLNVYILSVLAGLLLVPSFIAGLLGANVAGIPGGETPWAFAALTAFIVALVGLEIWILRRLRII